MKINISIKGFRYENDDTEDAVYMDDVNMELDITVEEAIQLISRNPVINMGAAEALKVLLDDAKSSCETRKSNLSKTPIKFDEYEQVYPMYGMKTNGTNGDGVQIADLLLSFFKQFAKDPAEEDSNDDNKSISWPFNYGETKFIGIPINKIKEEPTCPVCDKNHNTTSLSKYMAISDMIFNKTIKNNITIDTDTTVPEIVGMSAKFVSAVMKNCDVFSKELKFEPFINILNKLKSSYRNEAVIYAHDVVMEAIAASKEYDLKFNKTAE